jgi:ribosomal protein S18 acetylase RimI-like enzyme
MVVGETPCEPAWYRQIHIEDSPASLAVEMMMGQNVPVVTRCTNRRRNFIDLAVGHEYLEVPVHGPERERRHLGQQGFVDLGRRRMGIGLLNPAPDTISLVRMVATRGRRISLGGRIHTRRIVVRKALQQVKIEKSSELLDTPILTHSSNCRITATMTPMAIERMQPKDWERVRSIRMRALLDTPDAFGTTIEEHEAQSPDLWQERLASPNAATFLATRGTDDVGLITGAEFRNRQGACGLFGMWVAPEARRDGLATRLVDAVIRWARSAGYPHLILEVGDTNFAAIRLYERCGFVPNGRRGTLPPPRTHLSEHERAMDL